MTPLDASLQRGNRGCAKYLRLHGALPFCKMTDRHDIDRWLEHSFNINKLHQTEQLCDAEAPPPHHVLQIEEHMVETSRHVKTLETSVQTDSGYFESRDFLTGNAGLLTEANVAAITKQGTIVEGGRTLKQAIITNVYVRTSGATRTHQSKRRGKQADEKGPRHDNEYSGSCNKVEAEDGLITKTSRKQVLSDSKGHKVSEEVIIEKKEGKEGQVVKRIIRKPSGSDEEVWVSGELEDNMETTPEGFTSVSFSERKSNEALHASSGEELKKTTSRSTELLRAEKQDSGRQPAVERASEAREIKRIAKESQGSPAGEPEAAKKKAEGRSKISKPRQVTPTKKKPDEVLKEKFLEVEETLSKSGRSKVHREYEEIEEQTSTNFAEFVSETSMSDGVLEQKSDQLFKGEEHATEKHRLKNREGSRSKKMQRGKQEVAEEDTTPVQSNGSSPKKSISSEQYEEQEVIKEHATESKIVEVFETEVQEHLTHPQKRRGSTIGGGPVKEKTKPSTSRSQSKMGESATQDEFNLTLEQNSMSRTSREERGSTESLQSVHASEVIEKSSSESRKVVSTKHVTTDNLKKVVAPTPSQSRDMANSPVLISKTLVDKACGPSGSFLVDAGCNPRQVSIDKTERSTSPNENEYTVEVSCETVTEATESIACSPALQTTDASCSPENATLKHFDDATCSPDKAAQKADASCSPGTPVLKEVETKDAGCSPPAEAASPERADVASSPIGATDKVDDVCSPIKSAVDQTDQASSPPADFYKRDAGNNSKCSPIPLDFAKETRSVACSPPDLNFRVQPSDREYSSVAVSPIKPSVFDKASSPPETVTTNDALSSPVPWSPKVEKGSSPHKAYMKDSSCSPIPEANEGLSLGDGITADTRSPPLDTATAEAVNAARRRFKALVKDASSGTTPVKEVLRAKVVDASCSPIGFEYQQLSRSSTDSIDVEIPARSSSIEEAEKSPQTDIGAIPAFAEVATSPIEDGTHPTADSVGVLVKPLITDIGTSPLVPASKTIGTSTESKPEPTLSDISTSPVDYTRDSTEKLATKDASNSPISVPASSALALDGRKIKHVQPNKKHLRKSRSWDVMGFGGPIESLAREIQLPEINGMARGVSKKSSPTTNVSPVQNGSRDSLEKTTLEETSHLQKLPAIVKTASTPPDTTATSDARGNVDSPGALAARKKASLHPIGSKRHSLSQSDLDRSPESSIRSSDHTVTLKDSGFSDVERPHSGSSGEEDRTDHAVSDSAAQQLELQRRKLLLRRKNNKVAESVREQRKRRVPNLRPVSENYKSPEDMTLAVQESIRKYRLERQLFNELQELKRHQIRSGRTHENVLVKRLVDRYRELVLGPGMRDFGGPYTFRNYEMYLYGQLRDLSNSNDGKVPAKYKKKEGDREEWRGSDNALECVSESYKRRHAVEARALAPGKETQMRPVYQHPASKKKLLPAILPSPLTSVFTVVRGAPNIPTTRSTNYSHIKSRVFPQRPAERVKLTEAEEESSSKPLKQRFRSKDASTSTAGVSSNQASRLRVERIKKQREEETQRKSVEKSIKTVSVSEQRQVKYSSVIDLKKISEEDSESTTREETKQSYQETPTRRSKPTPKREAGKVATPSKSAASNQKPEQTSYRSPEASSRTAEAKSTFPFLKKHEGRLSISSTEPKIEDAEETPRRRFSKARNAAPKKSSALLPFWVPHDPSRVDTSKEDSSSARQKSSVRESLGEQAVRFKDWIKSRKSSKTGRRDGDSSETDSGHEGDGILPDERVKDALLEKVSRSLRKSVLPHDVVTMQLKPSPVVTTDDDVEAITRTVRMSEFLEAAQRDIVVNCVQLKPDNVSETGSSPDVVSNASDSPSSSGDSSDDGIIEFEIRHGREKNVFWLPTSKMRDNKKWQVTFIVAKAGSSKE
ncbi:unnamed protein product [Ixodes pacificus]